MNPEAVSELEKQYREALESQTSPEHNVELVPSLDARGRMYDIGAGIESGEASSSKPGNKRKKEAKVSHRLY